MGRSLEPLVGAGVPVGFVVVWSVAVHTVGIPRRVDGRLGYDNVILIPFGSVLSHYPHESKSKIIPHCGCPYLAANMVRNNGCPYLASIMARIWI